jgi:hypothetical protein
MRQKSMSTPLSRLGRQIAETAAALNAIGARFALIGGLALASYKVVRATQDVDLLVEAEPVGRAPRTPAKSQRQCAACRVAASRLLRRRRPCQPSKPWFKKLALPAVPVSAW